MKLRTLTIALSSLTASLGATTAATAATPTPIPSSGSPAPTPYVGAPATPHRVRGVPPAPRNRFMAPNGQSEIHNDAWQTDAFTWAGPLGRSPRTGSSYLPPGHDCGSVTFDRRGRVLSICVGLSGPTLYMFDPATLAVLGTFALPPKSAEELALNKNLFQDYTGGGYFFLDNQDRVVVGTTTRHIFVIGENSSGTGFTLQHDYDLSSVLTTQELITSALPDRHGTLWVVARRDGVVATLDPRTGAIHAVRLGQGAEGEIENSIATDPRSDAVYIATNRKLYRFGAGRHGRPQIVWQIRYPNSGLHKLGQVDDGTGTTPTVMPGGYVNITDNADPMDVMVYRTAKRPVRVVWRGRGHRRHLVRIRLPRQVCRVPVFSKGASDTENSIIGAGRSMIVENNYGYSDPTSISGGKLTAPGFARVDLNARGTGCRLAWTNRTERAPTVVSKLSLATGLIYTYTKDAGGADPWYWTTLDFRTGRTVYKQLSGTGNLGYNNNYAGIALSRRGVEYLGVLGGIVMLRDGP